MSIFLLNNHYDIIIIYIHYNIILKSYFVYFLNNSIDCHYCWNFLFLKWMNMDYLKKMTRYHHHIIKFVYNLVNFYFLNHTFA